MERALELDFTGERIVPGASNCEPAFARKMYQEHVARYAFAAQMVANRDVLDVACGVGYGSQLLGKAGAKSVLGIDLAEDAISHARKNYFHPEVTYRAQDAREMDYAGEFDLVTCFEFIEHVDEQERVLDAIKRALRPHGILVISTPRPHDELRTEFHVHELEYQELKRMLSERFENVQSFFERNCFTSFVGAALPGSIEKVIPVTERVELDDADYFVFVAYDGESEIAANAKAVLTLNDDEYIIRLEQDAINFRNGENYHKGVIEELSGRCESLHTELQNARSELDQRRSRTESLESLQSELLKIADDMSSIRAMVEDQKAHGRVEALEAELSAVKDELAGIRESRDEALRQNLALAQDNGRIRTVLSHVAQKLAETETGLNSKSAELAHERAVAGSLRNDLDTLRVRFEECERTLNRFRRSVSWAVTRPLRWVGRQYKKAARRGVA